MVRSKVDALDGALNVEATKAAWDVGGGVMFFFGTHVGVRADVRFFRIFGEVELLAAPKRLEFGRGSAGLIVRF